MSSNTPEPMPEQNGGIVVALQVIADIKERMEIGKDKYGTYLETDNGRDALTDAYQESLDLAIYLKQEILERNLEVSDTDKMSISMYKFTDKTGTVWPMVRVSVGDKFRQNYIDGRPMSSPIDSDNLELVGYIPLEMIDTINRIRRHTTDKP